MKGLDRDKENDKEQNEIYTHIQRNKRDKKGEEKKYKELTEERAKKLYEDLLVQYMKSGFDEFEAAKKAKSIIKKQCSIRGIQFWPWL